MLPQCVELAARLEDAALTTWLASRLELSSSICASPTPVTSWRKRLDGMNMPNVVNRIRQFKVYDWLMLACDAVYPPICLLCGAAGETGRDLCHACLLDLPCNERACSRCGLPLALGTDVECGRCQRASPPFDRTLAPYLYRPPIDKLIQSLKFARGFPEGRLLGMLLASAVPPDAVADAIVPIPLHPRRLRERGFNQAAEIARPLGRSLGIPVLSHVLRRVRPTATQTGFDANMRKRNVRGAFAAAERPVPKRIAILDDVITTGATASEAARALRRAGAEEIAIWAVARTPR